MMKSAHGMWPLSYGDYVIKRKVLVVIELGSFNIETPWSHDEMHKTRPLSYHLKRNGR